MDRQYIIDSLRFWETMPAERLKGDEAKALEAELRAAIAHMDDATLGDFREIAIRQYTEQSDTHASIASRGSALLLFVGVVSTGATLVAAAVGAAAPVVLALILGVGACLLYSCLAVAFLAVRAQEVAVWVVPAIYPKDGPDLRGLALEEATQHAFAYQQNKAGLRHLVAYLADAQRWARRAIILVVMLAVLSVAAAATKPPPASTATSPTSPVPSPQPSLAHP
jgi:hypothetical protein